MTTEKKFKNNKKNYKAKPAGKQKQWTDKKESGRYTEKKKPDFKKNTAPKGAVFFLKGRSEENCAEENRSKEAGHEITLSSAWQMRRMSAS